jgi:hypothetical protein
MKAERTSIATENTNKQNGNHERIQARAYELYQKRNREDGHAIDDWLQAEAELSSSEVTAA